MEKAATQAPFETRANPFQVRGTVQTILSLRLIDPDDERFFTLLMDKIAHAPDFFRSAPVVLDVAALGERTPIDLPGFLDQLRQAKLMPVGVQNGGPAWQQVAAECGLAMFSAGAPGTPRKAETEAPQPAAAAALPRRPAMVVTEPVRGGQQVHAPDGDLVVLAPVGHGAELLAAGHVHVYNTLRGRAFAGINGDESAMIFCDQLNAELLCIAGLHIVNEEIDQRLIGRRARVTCDGERLTVAPFP